MEQKEYASKGVAGAGLGLGIAGTALGLLKDGGLNGLFGGHGHHYDGYGRGDKDCGINMTQYIIENERRFGCLEAKQAADHQQLIDNEKIACLKDELALVKSERYTDAKTCYTVQGKVMINPNQMGDPYMGRRQVIATYPNGQPYGQPCQEPVNDFDCWY